MLRSIALAAAVATSGMSSVVLASSHREAPLIAGLPRLDGTDFYMFRSYEAGRGDFVTIIANYIPLQDPPGGPNFYALDPDAVYAINIDNNGDGSPDISFQFRFSNLTKGLTVPAGGTNVAVPLINIGPVDTAGKAVNASESYTVSVQSHGSTVLAQNATLGGTTFWKPVDNIGEKSIADYPSYAGNFIYDATVPGCSTPGRVFVGQRKEGFVANLGEIFDLVNLNPVGPRNGQPNTLSHKNVTSIAIEVPIRCITQGGDPVIAGWTTSSLPSSRLPASVVSNSYTWYDASGHAYTQVSRLANPLVNELVIGLPDKDRFNGSNPRDDAQFLTYVTNPTMPVLLNVLFGAAATVPGTPRNDLVTAFLTGLKGVNQPQSVHPAELMRLNTSLPPTQPAAQNDLGALAGDQAGFPNGRRPYDDVVDIELRVLEGAVCGAFGNCGSETADPNHGTPYTDGAESAGPDAADVHLGGSVDPNDTYLDVFPYLSNPLPGSPNGAF
jgi:hypothetical protein